MVPWLAKHFPLSVIWHRGDVIADDTGRQQSAKVFQVMAERFEWRPWAPFIVS